MVNELPNSLISQIVRDEGCRLSPYTDTRGKLTIGYGRNLTDCGVRADEAMILLQNDLQRATADVRRELPWTDSIDQARREVIVNMAFNMGIGKVLKFVHMLGAMQNNHWEEAANAALNSEWATQVGPRAARLATQIKTGQRQ